jgi:transposase
VFFFVPRCHGECGSQKYTVRVPLPGGQWKFFGTWCASVGVEVPAAHLEEFRRWADSLVVNQGAAAGEVAKGLGTRESGLRRWVDCDLVGAGRKPGVKSDERDEFIRLRRENWVLRIVQDLLSRAADFFADGTSSWK